MRHWRRAGRRAPAKPGLQRIDDGFFEIAAAPGAEDRLDGVGEQRLRFVQNAFKHVR
jgi:hypothetical protein